MDIHIPLKVNLAEKRNGFVTIVIYWKGQGFVAFGTQVPLPEKVIKRLNSNF